MHSDLISIVTSSELGGTEKLLILFDYYMMKFLSREVADDGQQNVRSRR